ncbi:hypothetical protein E2C01_051745 [Portunus trituberculatus]|uniref:Uncharacterized protein n=1 Tax=Portunus trituberculatus TaxID=210409 RepID=A0A5B7GLB0_PORTR|nr:hypothetical protein [Portunus trituberculatus]
MVDPHEECLSWREIFCSLASRYDCCKTLSHDQFLCLLDSIKDSTKRRKASSSGKCKSSPSSQELHKCMFKMEEMLGRLSLFLSSSQGFPFSGFLSPASQVDDSQPGTSGALQRPGQVRPAGAASHKIEMVQASAADTTTTTGGCNAVVPGAGDGVGDSHWSIMPSGHPTTQDTEVGNCHTAPMPGSQTLIQDIDGCICHTAPMPGGQPLIASRGFIHSSGKEMPGAPSTSSSVYEGGVGDSNRSTMPGDRPTTQEMEVSVCHTAPMPSSQTPFQDVEVGICHTAPMPSGQLIIPSHGLGVGVCPSAPMPGSHPLPHSGVNHMDPVSLCHPVFHFFRRILLRLTDQLLCLVAVGLWVSGKEDRCTDEEGVRFIVPLCQLRSPRPPFHRILSGQEFSVMDPMAGVDLTREVQWRLNT